METGNTANSGQTLSFEFTGKGFEYFKIWIVNICLTVLTLGIYSAWAKVRTNSYFYGNTIFDNSHFSYLADPVKILKGRIIAVALFAVYWGTWQFYPQAGIAFLGIGCLLFPFFLVTAMAFRMRNSAYRNIRFYFVKNLRGAYMIFVVPLGLLLLLTWVLYTVADSSGVLESMVTAGQEDGQVIQKEDFMFTAFTFALLPIIPWLDYLRTQYIINHIQFGKAKAAFTAGAWGFYKVYLLTFLAFILLSIALGFGMAIFIGGCGDVANIAVMIPVFIIIFYGFTFFIGGLWKALRTNMVNNNTKIANNQLQSHLTALKVGWIFLSNTIAIVCTLGMMIPWSKVRLAKYIASCTELNVEDIDSIRAIQQEDNTAFGEEMGEAFDLDFGM